MPDQQPQRVDHNHDAPAAVPSITPATAPQADPHRLSSQNMPSVPVVDWRELSAAPNLAAVRALYSERGRTFDSEAALVAQLKADWKVWRNAEFVQAMRAPLPKEYPVVTTTVDGKPRTLIGIVHTLSGDPDVYALHRLRVAQYPLPLAEQNLGFGNLGLHSLGMEIPDHYVYGIFRSAISDEISRWSRGVKNLMRSIKARMHSHPEMESSAETPETEAGRSMALIQQGRFKRDAVLASMARVALHMPADLLVYDLPTGVRLDLTTKGGTKLDRITARSAYMAEFLRHYDSEQTFAALPSSAELPPGTDAKHTAFVCGAGHVQEILYFWEQGVKDQRIAQRALRDAALLSSDPIAFIHKMERMKRDAFLAQMGLIAVECGAVFGTVSFISSLL